MQVNKKTIRQIDIYNEQFNYFFVEKLNKITPDESKLIPSELRSKIFHRGNAASAERLNFQEKVWILSVVFGHNITLMIDSSENPIGIKEFNTALSARKGKKKVGEVLSDLRAHSAFVIADKELMAAALFMNHVSASNIYSLAKELIENVNHKVNVKFMAGKKMVNIILSFMINYEANKKRLAMDYGLTIPRWYALLYFSTGEKKGADFYTRDFALAYSATRWTMHKEMKWLFDNGYLSQRGKNNDYKYSLSSAGINLLNRIFDNLLLKF